MKIYRIAGSRALRSLCEDPLVPLLAHPADQPGGGHSQVPPQGRRPKSITISKGDPEAIMGRLERDFGEP